MKYGNSMFGGKRNLQLKPLPVETEERKDDLFAEKTPFYLLILDFFKRFLVKRGVDYERLRLIVQVKMAINERSLQNPLTNSAQMRRFGQSTTTSKKSSLLKGMLLQGIFGVFFSLLLLSPITDFSVYFVLYSVFFILFITILIPQLAQVFLSGEDAEVLPVRPVDARVLSLAKVIQVGIYLAINYLVYIVPTLVVGIFKRGIKTSLLAIPTTMLLSVFALLLALALYLVVAQFFSGEKLRNMVTYVQILLSMFSFATYQMITPLLDLFGKAGIILSPWLLVWPPTWFSAPFILTSDSSVSPLTYVATALGLLSVIILAALYFAKSGKLERRLQDLALQKDGEEKEGGKIRDFFSRLLCRSPQERAYFRFSWQMMRHERSFKTAVYPLLVTYAVLPYIFLVTVNKDVIGSMLSLNLPIYYLYMNILGMANVILSLQASDYAEAGWIFRVIPEKSDGAFATALAKSVWAKLYVPLLILQVPLQWLIHGRDGILAVGILFFLSFLVTLALVVHMDLVRPFTSKRTLIQQEGCGYVLMLFGIWIVFALIHGLLRTYVPWGVEVYIGVLALLTILSISFYRSKRVFRDKTVV